MCKHLKYKFLVSLFISVFLFPFIIQASSNEIKLQKPKVYQGDEDISNWFMSEKLDGIRGYWNGKEFQTRKGNIIYTPGWFTINYPPFELDGELWSERNNFEFIQSTVLDKSPSIDWKKISYNIFEVPNAKGDFPSRLEKAKSWFSLNKNLNVKIIPQIVAKNREHLQIFLKEIESKGGEGVIIKNPNKMYHTGRSPHVLKVKNFSDMEGKVISINKGKGRLTNMMGSLTIELKSGLIFKLGSGFTDKERRTPPWLGSIVTFKYYGYTKNKKPKFASFLRIRQE